MNTIRAETFRSRDSNRDGRLTVDEYGGHPGNFAALDANNDRVLSEDEFVNRRGRGARPLPQAEQELRAEEAQVVLFGMVDRNRDGVITRGEWQGSRASFDAYDTNRDERLTQAEHVAAVRTQSDVTTLAARYMDRDTNRDGRLSSNEWRTDEGATFSQIDTNADRAITLHEYVYRGSGTAQDFSSQDTNRDGRISRSEWRRGYDEFARLDRNNDGMVTTTEYSAPLDPDSGSGTFQAMDTNNDGAISRREWRVREVSFDVADRNDDGMVSEREFAAHASPTEGAPERVFYQMDRNRDEVVSRTEWRHERLAFHVADRNGDGVVTLREWRALPATGGNEREATFDLRDVNNDYVVSRREWNDADGDFTAVDRNRDGVVTRNEWLNAPPAEHREAAFEDQDYDNDGVVSRREWRGTGWEFDRLDANRDRVVTFREFEAAAHQAAPTSRRDRFAQLDRDRDSYISRQEWQGDPESFAILDSQRDGRLSSYEFLDTRRIEERFSWLDHDDDGRLDRDEWPGTDALLTRLDLNRDGAVSREEFLQ